MYRYVPLQDFKDCFKALRPNNFSDEGLEVLFEYIEALEYETGDRITFGVIDLCSVFAEEEWKDLEGGPFKTYDDAERYLKHRTKVVARVGKDRVIYEQY